MSDVALQIGGDASGLAQALDAAETELKAFGDRATSIFASGTTGAFNMLARSLGKELKFDPANAREFAKELNAVTKFEKDAAFEAQFMLAKLNKLNPDELKKVTLAAADLAAVLGKGIDEVAGQFADALDDPEKMLVILNDANIQLTKSEKELYDALLEVGNQAGAMNILWEKLDNNVGGAAQNVRAQVSAWDKFQSVIGDGVNKVMEVLQTTFDAFLPTLTVLGDMFKNVIFPVLDQFKAYINEITGGVKGDLTATIKDFVLQAADYISQLVAHFQGFWDTLQIGFTSAKLMIATFVEDFKYFFTDALPGYAKWFADNFVSIMGQMGKLFITILQSLYEHFTDFWAHLKKLFSDDGTAWEPKGLIEGFKLTLDKLPEIAARARTETEAELSKTLDQLKAEADAKFQANVKANRAAIDRLAQVPEQEKKVQDELNRIRKINGPFLGKNDEKKQGSEDEKPEASPKSSLEDLISLNNRITQAANSPEDLAKKQLDVQKKQLVAGQAAAKGMANLINAGNRNAGKIVAAVGKAGALQ
jgi:hypothetical protein